MWLPLPVNTKQFQLISNAATDYDLFLRYTTQKETINSFSISVAKHWWQESITLFLFFILVLIVCFLFYRRYKNLNAERVVAMQKQTLLEIKTIQAQLNPHFIFNALGSIQGLMNMGKVEEANHYLSDFSLLMRNTLSNSDKINTSLSMEIKTMEQYLKLEQLRFGFMYEIKCAKDINKDFTEIPTLLLQPSIENAIKHGVSKKGKKGIIKIFFEKNNNDFVIHIYDNGDGFISTHQNNGYGIKLVEERIKLLNKNSAIDTIKYFTKSAGNGTEVIFIFKKWI